MTIFRLPIYLETREAMQKKIEKKVQTRIEKIYEKSGLSPTKKVIDYIQNFIEQENGHGCDYNRAIGWIDIRKGRTGLYYSVYAVDSRRKKIKNRTLRILNQDDCITWHLIKLKNLNSNEKTILDIQDTMNYILNNCKKFKDCYIDQSTFLNVAPCIDWKIFLGKNSK